MSASTRAPACCSKSDRKITIVSSALHFTYFCNVAYSNFNFKTPVFSFFARNVDGLPKC